MRPLRRATAATLAALLLAGITAASAATAAAAPAQQQCGNTDANPSVTVDRPTIGVGETAVVTVTGRGYLLPPHVCGTDVFGGVYLFFGWVQPGGQWGPSFTSSTSTQGLFGTTYSYPGEGGGGETRDDGTGTVRLVSFTAGGESGRSTPFHMDADGNWTSNLTVRGATYSYEDLRTGTSNTVDCRVVQCGVFTIGAHGKASRTNERFTPINFTDPSGAPIVPTDPGAGGAGGVTSSEPSPAAGAGATSGASRPGGSSPDAGAEVAGETTLPEQVGSVGEEPTTTAFDGRAGDDGLDSERAASVQDFGGDSGDGSGTGLLVGGMAVMVALVIAGAVVLLRRRGRGAEVRS